MKIALIAALSKNRVIGVGNRLPWHLPADLKRFRTLTSGHPVIMGRKTFESIGRPLPDRLNIVVSRRDDYHPSGVVVVKTIEAAIAEASTWASEHKRDEVFVIGGAEIYAQALPRAERLYLTLIDLEIEGDAFFPKWDSAGFVEVSREDHSGDDITYSFVILERY